jgi:regulatory protein
MKERKKLQRKIVAIKCKGQKNPKRLIIFSDKSVFEISEDVFVSANLDIGSEVDEHFLEELEEKETGRKAFYSALTLLNYRMRSTAELRKRLFEKEYNHDTIDRVIEKLNERKFLNDESFARAFINDKINTRFLGPIALRRELFPHKLNNELVEKLLLNAYEETPEEELVERLLIKRRINEGQKLTQKEKNRLINYLQRRGHTWGVINNVLNKRMV